MFYPGLQKVVRKTEVINEKALIIEIPLQVTEKKVICQRCGQKTLKKDCQLPIGAYYCPHCLAFGRITSNDLLVSKSARPSTPRQVMFAWTGKLTPSQEAISQQLVAHFHQQRKTLIFAVTGAGKTEMLFSVIYEALALGQKVCLSSPRIDVCRELLPRLQQAFPLEDILFRYGEGEPYRETALLLCTTHQLLHFKAAFDLLIIDEIDAFPYTGDSRLAFAAEKALKVGGCRIELSATPQKERLKAYQAADILYLPGRYHGRPLIQPKKVFWNNWQQAPKQKRQLNRLRKELLALLRDNHVLIFCPSVRFLEVLSGALAQVWPEVSLESVSAQDEQRAEKIGIMRQGGYQLLFTSTILERGVTFENISVVVFGADHPVFNKSTLVQIAGRVDRKGAYQHGQVLYCYGEMTTAIRAACQEITALNHRARKAGLLNEM